MDLVQQVCLTITLCEYGFKPIVIERGEDIKNRIRSVNKYWTNNILNEESNVQFGEGGAGTFSDGKLTARINDKRADKVIELFVKMEHQYKLVMKTKHI